MSQLTIYLDEASLRKTESAASLANIFLSKWVEIQLMKSLENQWPEGYSNLFGSLNNKDLPKLTPLDLTNDSLRESL